jgi:TRAP-type mannitol/chloroaromatic compound transport system substrate-binding protein
MVYDFQAKNAQALQELKKLGVHLQSFPQEIVEAAKKALYEVIEEQSRKSEDFKEVWRNIEPFWLQNRAWTSLGLKNFLQMRDG